MPAYQRLGSRGSTGVIIIGSVLIGASLVGVVCAFGVFGAPSDGATQRVHKEFVRAKAHGTAFDTATPGSAIPHYQEAKRAEANHTEHELGHANASGVSGNESDNESVNLGNLSRPNETDCRGGPAAACECILGCQIFGNSSAKCHDRSHRERRELVDELISETMTSHRSMCEGMICIRDCALKLGCMDRRIVEDCSVVRDSYDSNRLPSEPKCDLHCGG